MVLVIVFFVVSQFVQVCSSYWLGDWSDKVDQEKDNPNLRNKRLKVYIAFGLSQSKEVQNLSKEK